MKIQPPYNNLNRLLIPQRVSDICLVVVTSATSWDWVPPDVVTYPEEDNDVITSAAGGDEFPVGGVGLSMVFQCLYL